MKRPDNSGFTLIELSMVVLLITILAAIAVPKYGEAMRNSTEGSTRANLGSLRKALSVYYTDLDGQYPADTASLLSRYLRKIPSAKLPGYHPDSNAVLHASASDDAGGWYYDNVAGSAGLGVARVNCSHTDAKGSIWTSY